MLEGTVFKMASHRPREVYAQITDTKEVETVSGKRIKITYKLLTETHAGLHEDLLEHFCEAFYEIDDPFPEERFNQLKEEE